MWSRRDDVFLLTGWLTVLRDKQVEMMDAGVDDWTCDGPSLLWPLTLDLFVSVNGGDAIQPPPSLHVWWLKPSSGHRFILWMNNQLLLLSSSVSDLQDKTRPWNLETTTQTNQNTSSDSRPQADNRIYHGWATLSLRHHQEDTHTVLTAAPDGDQSAAVNSPQQKHYFLLFVGQKSILKAIGCRLTAM